MKTALIAGSTGLIGKQLLGYLLDSDRYGKVIAITRSRLEISHSKLVEVQVDFSKLIQVKDQLLADDIFCCLGTTMAKARSKQKFREVDFEYPVTLARISEENNAHQFMLVSALGADKQSSVFYNQVKGELEEAVSALKFDAIHIFRPSLLLGDRKEHRSAEDAAKFVYKIFGFLIPAKYKAIDSAKVARAMLTFAAKDERGTFIHESKEMQTF